MTFASLLRNTSRIGSLSGLLAMTLVGGGRAQTSTGSIRGYVRDSSGTPVVGARVVVVNVQTSTQREVATQNNGFYAILGLVPAAYDVTARQIGMAPQKVRVRVLIGEVFPLDFKLAPSAIQLEAVTVAAATAGIEMRTSEAATNVTQQQLNDLPTSNRNIFDLAALAPGMVTQNDQINSIKRTFVAGAYGPAYGADQVNVFVDGASYKNDILRGGVVGQDRSRGNVFPRNSVQEFRVITQNYKAEYQKASSGIIVATTKSGG
ncbi:MAG TPA: carboxypeptidase-like regulatory domain-containing protein, partial [Gemmatimonadales bacterium]|nr:carboxypeptidase-like regulatory domain-containing protein [Gemmatimonadales bacterium]